MLVKLTKLQTNAVKAPKITGKAKRKKKGCYRSFIRTISAAKTMGSQVSHRGGA